MRIMTSAALLVLFAATTMAQKPDAASSAGQDFKWGPAPAVFAPGAQMAVLQGNPGGTGLFTVRLKMPDGYKIAPHTHPTDENVTVVSGTFRVGMGEKFERKGMMTLHAGGFVTAPQKQAHYAVASGETIVQVHAMGPFSLTYVNPADTPKAAVSRR
jgi:quercetin dioxygenase-like cupin family protein